MAQAILTLIALAAWTLTANADLKVHWPLDESSGNVAADASGEGNDGDWQGSSGSAGWTPTGGIDGGAVTFSGTDEDYFITSGFSAVSETPFTLSAWVRTTSSQKDGLVYLGDGSSGGSYYLMQIQGGNAKVVARNPSEEAASGPDVDDDDWHHLVCVYNSATDRRIYVDGEHEGTDTDEVLPLALNRFGIGALTRSSPTDLYTGQLDDVAVWDRAFSLTDIAALRGLVRLEAGNAAHLEAFAAGFASQESALVRGRLWIYANGLSGGIGTTAGSIDGGDASIVLDGDGNGMILSTATEPDIISFSANYPAITPGVPVTLSWQSVNTTSASISGIGSVDASSGSIVVNPTSNTTYTLTVINGEDSVQAHVDITLATGPANPEISEFLAKNDTGLQDEDGTRPDWIEIHNASPFALDVSGYKLTNDALQLSMWSFPSLILGADEYLVVFASAKDRSNPAAPLHTNFTIGSSGSYLALVSPDATTIVQEFAPAYPQQASDLSYSAAGYHSPATPGEENGEGALHALLEDKVTFGTPGGLFFGGSINLMLSHPDSEATIRYTLDGSIPDASSQAYSIPFPVTSSTLVKARAFRTDHVPGPSAQEGYIFADPALSSFDSDVPILVIDTFSTEVPRNDTTFKDAAFATFDPLPGTDRAALIDPKSEGGNSGIHVRGESSQAGGFNKLNFAFETRDTEGEDKDISLFGMPAGSDWALHASEIDRTFIREQLPHHLFREIGRYSPRTRPVEVYLNQDGGPVSAEDYRGLYLVVERIRRDNKRVDIAKLDADENTAPDVTGGYIFKRDKSDSGDVRVSTVNEGSFAITYPNENNITLPQRDYLETYLRDFETALHGESFTDPVEGYAAYIDVQSFIDMHVIQELTKEVDSYHFSTFYFKDKDGKIGCGPLWDFDRSFGNVNTNGIDDPEGWRGGPDGDSGSFWERLFEDPDFEQGFIDRWQELMESTLDEANLHMIVDIMAAEVDEAKDRNFEPVGPWPLANVTRSHLTFPTYSEHVTYLKDWISTRLAWVETQFTEKPQFVQAPGIYNSDLNLSLTAAAGTIYFTTDGSDPRAPGGGISGAAYSGAIPISTTSTVIARTRIDNDWSGPLRGTFIIGEAATTGNLVVSEIMYHPSQASSAEISAGHADEESFEYIEFMNIGTSPIEMAGVVISGAFDFTFGISELPPGGRALLVRNQAAYSFRHGAGQMILGEYGPQALGNGGERLVVTAADNSPILDFQYDDIAPWPTAPDGSGSSLILINPFANPSHEEASNWRSGTPSPGDNGGTLPFSGGDLVSYAVSSHGGDGTLFFFAINPAAEGIEYTVEVSDDLATWESGATFIDYLGETAQGRLYQAKAAPGPRRFMRLRMVAGP